MVAVGDGVRVHQIERHGRDLAFKAGRAWTHVSLNGIHVREEREDLVDKSKVRFISSIHRSRTLAISPTLVLLPAI